MAKLKNLRSKVFYKYLISYLVIFSIPFIVLSTIVYNNAVLNLKDSIESSNINKLDQVKDMTDTRMEELRNIATRISFDDRLTPYMVRNEGYQGKEAISELNRFKANSSIIDELFLYYHGDDVLYSSSGLMSLNTLMGYSYQFNNWNSKQLSKDLNLLINPTVRPVEGITDNGKHERMLSYFYPISPNSSYPYGTVMFLIKESTLNGLIDNILGDFQGSVYVFGKNQNLLAYEHNGTVENEAPQIRKFLNQDNAGVEDVQINNEKYSLMSVQSDKSEWTFVTVMPTHQFFSRVAKVRTFIIVILLSLFLIGIAASIFWSRKHYRPIKELVYYMKSWGKVSGKDQNKGELEHIKDSINQTYFEQKNLLTQLEKSRPLVREQFFIHLLKGTYQKKQEIERLIDNNHIKMIGSQFFVMYVSMGGRTAQVDHREEVLEDLKIVSFSDGIGYGVELIYENAAAVIVNMLESQDVKEKQAEMANRIIDLFQKKCNMTPVVGIGKTYQDVTHINRSFIEASASIEYKLMNGQGPLIYFDDIQDLTDRSSWYPIEEEVKLSQSIKQGDQHVAMETLHVMMESIAAQEQSILLLKCMCFDVINTVLKTITEMNLKEYSKDVKDLLEFDSLEELRERLNHLILDICSEVKQLEENNDRKLCDEILGYIQDYFKAYHLSLESVAEQFQLSVSYLSRYIKEQTGHTFTNYVTNLRIEEVKHALTHSDKPIKDIIRDVGYSDLPNFTRKFKKLEGITPGQYRKSYAIDTEKIKEAR